MGEMLNKFTPEEQGVLFQRLKENRNNRWRPIFKGRPKFGSAEKAKWWWKKKSER